MLMGYGVTTALLQTLKWDFFYGLCLFREAHLSSFSLFVLPKRGYPRQPRLPSRGTAIRTPLSWFPRPIMPCQALGWGRKPLELELGCLHIALVWNFASWELQWKSWMTDRLTFREGGPEKLKYPENRHFYPWLPLDLWMMHLMVGVPWLLYSLRNKSPKQVLLQWTQARSKERQEPDLAPVLGDLGETQSARLSGKQLHQEGGEGNNFFSRAEHHSMFAWLLVCSWGLCLFFSSSAQTQLHSWLLRDL